MNSKHSRCIRPLFALQLRFLEMHLEFCISLGKQRTFAASLLSAVFVLMLTKTVYLRTELDNCRSSGKNAEITSLQFFSHAGKIAKNPVLKQSKYFQKQK